VANGVEHLVLKSNFDRIFDIKFVNRCVQFAALLNDCGEVLVQPADDFIDLSIRNFDRKRPINLSTFSVLRLKERSLIPVRASCIRSTE